jgi:hypothetical protein
VTMAVREFIKALIQHIPDRNFKMIRHYCAYSRGPKGNIPVIYESCIWYVTFEDFITKANKWAPNCPSSYTRGRKMTFVCYEKGPPIENEVFGCRLADWNHPLLSRS